MEEQSSAATVLKEELRKLGLTSCAATFIELGYDDWGHILRMNAEQFDELAATTNLKPGHRVRLKEHISLKQACFLPLACTPHQNGIHFAVGWDLIHFAVSRRRKHYHPPERILLRRRDTFWWEEAGNRIRSGGG